MIGGIMSRFTFTSKQHDWIIPPDMLVQQTVVRPGGKKLPEGREQVTGRMAPVQVLIA
jgi:hypothetical protein